MRHTYHQDEVNGFSFSLIHNTILNIAFGIAFSAILSVVLGIAVYPSHVSAYGSTSTTVTKNASVTVSAACSFSSGGGEYSRTLNSGSNAEITANNITTSCNDLNGYAVYAIGYSGDSYDSTTHTDMISSLGSSYNIKTDGSGTYGSSWKMKITPVSNATAENSFNTYQNIPDTFTKVARYTANTNNGTITPSYQINVANSQPAGTYEGKVKYVLVHPNDAGAPSTAPGLCTDTATCMQTSTTCDTTLTDARDGNTYTVATINGACWMTQNLRYLGDTGSAAKTMTIDDNNSNVANKSITLYSLDSSDAGNFNAYSSHCDSTNGYNYACVYDSGSTSTGVWYNYYAATGGTISTNSNSTAATSDICPAGWRLPTYSEFYGIRSYPSAFSPVTGGVYSNGSLTVTGYGFWWSATAYGTTTTNRYHLSWGGSSLDSNSGNNRYYGFYVRCVRSS